MATLSEMLMGSAIESSKKAPDALRAMQVGAQLGQTIQNMRTQREQLEMQKQENENAKLVDMTQSMEKARNLSGKALQGYKRYLNAKAATYKLEGVFSPDTIELVTAAPENLDRFAVIVDEVQNGSMTMAQATEKLKDQGQFYDTPPDAWAQLRKASEIATADRTSMDRTQVTADATAQRAQEARNDSGEVEVRKKTAQTYSTWKQSGGSANVKKRVEALDNAIKALQEGNVKLGTVGKNVPYASSQAVLARTDPKAKEVVDNVYRAMDLKALLADPNPTQKQIDDARATAIDPRLDNAANIRSLTAARQALIDADTNAQEDFKRYGFLKGRQEYPAIPKAKVDGFKKLKKADQEKALSKFMEYFNLPADEVRRQLGVK